jgi:hypothetical protein
LKAGHLVFLDRRPFALSFHPPLQCYLSHSITQKNKHLHRQPSNIIAYIMAQTSESSSTKPDQKTLQEAGELEVFDESGKAIPFYELYNTEGRTVVVFIRHFFCGVSAPKPNHRTHAANTNNPHNSTAKTTCAN